MTSTSYESLKLLREDAVARGMSDLAIACGWTMIEIQFRQLNEAVAALNGRSENDRDRA